MARSARRSGGAEAGAALRMAVALIVLAFQVPMLDAGHAVVGAPRSPQRVQGPAPAPLRSTKAVISNPPAPVSSVPPAPSSNTAPVPPSPPPPAVTDPPRSRTLSVPWYHQEYELSCEAASLRMALAHEGIATTDTAILDIIGIDRRRAFFENGALRWGDPFTTFVGDPNGSEVALTGYGTYYPTIARAAAALGGSVLTAGQSIDAATVYAAILQGHPVVAWVTYQWVTPGRADYTAFDSRAVPYAGPVEHAVTVVGVDEGAVLINNPWSGPEWVSKATFEAAYAVYDQMAVILA